MEFFSFVEGGLVERQEMPDEEADTEPWRLLSLAKGRWRVTA